jgi:hypothetical protein
MGLFISTEWGVRCFPYSSSTSTAIVLSTASSIDLQVPCDFPFDAKIVAEKEQLMNKGRINVDSVTLEFLELGCARM